MDRDCNGCCSLVGGTASALGSARLDAVCDRTYASRAAAASALVAVPVLCALGGVPCSRVGIQLAAGAERRTFGPFLTTDNSCVDSGRVLCALHHRATTGVRYSHSISWRVQHRRRAAAWRTDLV